MKRLAMITMVALTLSASTQAWGESPQDCLTQEGCFCALNTDGVYVVRNGYQKGFIDNMGTGTGWVSCSKSIVIVTRQSDNNVYVSDLRNGGAKCSIDVGEECRPGLMSNIFLPGDDIVYVICPTSELLWGFEPNCSNLAEGPSGGYGPELLVDTGTSLVAGHNDQGTIGVFDTPGGAIPHMTGFSSLTGLVYNETLGALLMNNYDGSQYGIFQMASPWSTPATSTLFASLPGETTYMSGSDLYVAVSSTGSDLYVVDIATQAVTQTINVGAPGRNAVSEDNVYVVDSGEIKVYDPTTGSLLFSYTSANFGTLVDVSRLAPTQQGFCGDTIVQTQDGESCDGTEMDHQDCISSGYEVGTLVCDGSCHVDSSGCSNVCGNGTASPTETCDQSDTKGRTCEDEGFVGGTLVCNGTCDGFDTSGCTNCGNGQIDPGETCDPGDGATIPQNLNGEVCQTIGNYTDGQLACNATCDAFIEDECTSCGDGVADVPYEECDDTDMGGSTCSSLGLGSGTLACYQNCTINTQGCSTVEPQCGDNTVDAGEECDDGNRINGDGCDENCYEETADCGNGQIDAGEECDPGDGGSIPVNLNGETCESRANLGGGTLLCTSSCRFDETYCDPGYAPEGANLVPNADPSADDLNDTQAADLYELNTETLTEQCEAQIDGEDLIITSPEDSYCNYGAESLNKTRAGGAWIHLFPTEEGTLPRMRITPEGEFIIEQGASLVNNRGMQIFHGDRQVSENKEEDFIRLTEIVSECKDVQQESLVIAGLKGLADFCLAGEEGNPDKCMTISGDGSRQCIPLGSALDTFDWKLDTPSSGGCSTSGNSMPATPLTVLLILLGIGIRRRRRKRS